MSKKSILIVEADTGLRTILTLALEDKGHIVMIANTAEEALLKVSLSTIPIGFILYHIPQDDSFSLNEIKKECLRKFNRVPLSFSPILKEETSGLINLRDLDQFLISSQQ